MDRRSALIGLASAFTASHSEAAWPSPVTLEALIRRPRGQADRRVFYGAEGEQFGDLWLPSQPGRRPVAVLIHGGCWQGRFGLSLMDYAAGDLRQRGFIVWNIEYRRLGQSGGGYPGTFEDVGRAVDALRDLAKTYPLDLRRVVLIGHSAGGQLALWAAARDRLPAKSDLHAKDPLPVRGVISLAGIADLDAYRQAGPSCGGAKTITSLLAGSRGGGDRNGAMSVYDDTSPAALLPLKISQVVVSGAADPIVPSAFGQSYADKARAAGDPVKSFMLGGAGHFDLIDPTFPEWPRVAAAAQALVR